MFYKPRAEGYKPTEVEIQGYVMNQAEQMIIIQNIYDLVEKYPSIETNFNTDREYWFNKSVEELRPIASDYRLKVLALSK